MESRILRNCLYFLLTNLFFNNVLIGQKYHLTQGYGKQIIKDFYKEGNGGYLNDFGLFDLNMATYGRFYISYEYSGKPNIEYFDKFMNKIDSNIYLPSILGVEDREDYYYLTKDNHFDKTIYFKSSIQKSRGFLFESLDGRKLDVFRPNSFINGTSALRITNERRSYIDINGVVKQLPDNNINFDNGGSARFSFLSNYAKVKIDNGPNQFHSSLYNFINKEGQLLSRDNFVTADNFSEGLAGVCNEVEGKSNSRHNSCGYINSKGEMEIPFKFSNAGPFDFGIAKVTEIISQKNKVDWKRLRENINYNGSGEVVSAEVKERTYFIDKAGKEIHSITSKDWEHIIPVEGAFVYAYEEESKKNKVNSVANDLFSLSGKTKFIELNEKKVVEESNQGVISKSGKVLFSTDQNMEIYKGDPTDGVFIIRKPFEEHAYIYNGGDELIKIPNYNFSRGFYNGLAMVVKETGNKNCPNYPSILKNGRIASENLLSFCENQVGYINLKGELQIPYSLRYGSNFGDSRALVLTNELKLALIDEKGNIIKGSEKLNQLY